MTQETLLLVFIGLVALAIAGIAVSFGAIAWQLVKLVKEARALMEDAHRAGRVIAADITEFSGEVRREGARAKLALGMLREAFTRSLRKSRTMKKDRGREDV